MEHQLEIKGNVPKKVRRFVLRHYEKWLQAHSAKVGRALERASVTIDRVGRGHFVLCTIRLDTPSGPMRGQETGPNLHWTFDECLRQLDVQMSGASGLRRLQFLPAPARA